jgi:hypothetical protein
MAQKKSSVSQARFGHVMTTRLPECDPHQSELRILQPVILSLLAVVDNAQSTQATIILQVHHSSLFSAQWQKG